LHGQVPPHTVWALSRWEVDNCQSANEEIDVRRFKSDSNSSSSSKHCARYEGAHDTFAFRLPLFDDPVELDDFLWAVDHRYDVDGAENVVLYYLQMRQVPVFNPCHDVHALLFRCFSKPPPPPPPRPRINVLRNSLLGPTTWAAMKIPRQ